MTRDESLKSLISLREQLLITFSSSEKCKELKEQIDKLFQSKDNPPKLNYPQKPENNYENLMDQFIEENRAKITKGRLIELILILLALIPLVLLSIKLIKEVAGLDSLPAPVMLVSAVHFLFSVLIAIWPLAISKNAAKIMMVVTPIAYFLLIVMYGNQTGFLMYYFLDALKIYAAVVIAVFLVKIIRKLRVKNPGLSSKQKAELVKAKQTDEQNRAANSEAKAAAEKELEITVANHIRDCERQIVQKSDEFNENIEILKENIEKLDAMDCLGNEEKELQTVELLIRFIETRRADSIKEALHEYDKLMTNQQLLQIENEKLQVARDKAAQEHADRMQELDIQRKHNWEMEFRARCDSITREMMARDLNEIKNAVIYETYYK